MYLIEKFILFYNEIIILIIMKIMTTAGSYILILVTLNMALKIHAFGKSSVYVILALK